MQNIKDFIVTVKDGFELDIPVNTKFNGLAISNITMFVAAEEDEWGFADSDLAVNYSTEYLQDDSSAHTMGTLLLRDCNSDDEVTHAMSMFYWNNAYTSTLKHKLVAAGVSAAAASDVYTSEWGMQGPGRASYDAYALANEVRAAML
jgi:hypothetical protein